MLSVYNRGCRERCYLFTTGGCRERCYLFTAGGVGRGVICLQQGV